MVPRRALPLLLAPVALIVGCDSGDDELVVEATPAAVQSAGQATLEAESASIEFSLSIDPSNFGVPVDVESFDLTGTGVIDFAGAQSEMTFDLSGLAEAINGGDQAGLYDEPMRMVQDGTTSYICFSLFEVFAGGECMKIDLSQQLDADAAGSLFTGGVVDPTAFLESLGGAGAVEDVGEEELFGVQTRHLHGSYTLADAIALLDEAEAAQLQATFDQLGLSGEFADTPQAFDVWIDGDGRVRQVHQEIDLAAITGEDTPPVVVEFRYVEFGVPVDIDVPTDAVDISELNGLLGG